MSKYKFNISIDASKEDYENFKTDLIALMDNSNIKAYDFKVFFLDVIEEAIKDWAADEEEDFD